MFTEISIRNREIVAGGIARKGERKKGVNEERKETFFALTAFKI